MEIEVANVGTDSSRRSNADLGIHVGSIHVHLPATLMYVIDDRLDLLLKLSIGARISNHQCSQVLLVLIGLLLQISDINVTRIIALDYDNFHPAHGSGLKIC